MGYQDGKSTVLNMFANQRCWKLSDSDNPSYFSSGHSDVNFHKPTLQRLCPDTKDKSITRALLSALLGILVVVTPQIHLTQRVTDFYKTMDFFRLRATFSPQELHVSPTPHWPQAPCTKEVPAP